MTPYEQLELDRILTLIAMEAKSVPGKAIVSGRRPLATLEACDAAQAELADMVRFYHREGLLPLAGLTAVAPYFDRETVLDIDEAWIVVRATRATAAIREALLRSDEVVHLTPRAEAIPDLAEVQAKTSKYFTRDGKLREEASSELRSIRQRIHQKRAAIQKSLNELMNRHADAIQEPLIVIRGDRYCIPVRSDHRQAVPGILHERSGSGASFFIEPLPTVELNNDLADLLIQEREEIARITRLISQILFDYQAPILAAVDAAAELDAIQACALMHDTLQATRPTFTSERELRLVEARHPLIDQRLAAARAEAFGETNGDRTVVPVTLHLDGRTSTLIVSGPNAGGKTVALKTAGLIVAMAMSGLPVPASEETIIPVVDAIHVLIGDDQSVLEHLSTFSAYLLRLKNVLERATHRSLVLLDELGSGTDPEEGAALAASVIEHLLDIGALLIVTTHLSSLKGFAVSDTRVVNASMEFDATNGLPTYRLVVGIPGRSRALETAQKMGLPSSLLVRAHERLGDRYAEADTLLASLQKQMSMVIAQREEITALRHDLESERTALSAVRTKLEAERTKLGASFRDELERVRDDVTRQLAAEIRAIREADKQSRASLSAQEVARTVTKPLERAMEFLPAEEREVRVGQKAEHRKFKVTGDVLEVSGAKAILSVNGRKMQVETRDLVPLESGRPKQPPKTKPVRHSGESSSDVAVQISAELNLIGHRIDEALDESDKFLDRALLEGRQAVRIIHGFGTGALRKAVRDYLRKHPAVRSWRPGDDNEGGDGATVAVLDA